MFHSVMATRPTLRHAGLGEIYEIMFQFRVK